MIKNKNKLWSLMIVSLLFYGYTNTIAGERIISLKMINQSLDKAILHAQNMSSELKNHPLQLPRSVDKEGKFTASEPDWWTSGFFPGELWYLYEYSKKENLLKMAQSYSAIIESQKWATNNHDIGFMLYCSFGNGYRLTQNTQYKETLITAAYSMMKRYNSRVGLIRSWDFNKDIWQYPVIIDNMMNLELLLWAAKNTNDSTLYNAALSHADKTMKYHFRPDYSCWHVVSYDTITGLPHIKQTHQGLNDSSTWVRGQGWALYGFTMVYRESGQKRFLDHAVHIADFIIHNPAMSADKIPIWDFNDSSDSYRDASAAALIASALIELAQYVPEHKTEYLNFAKKQLKSLGSKDYSAQPGTNNNFILKHCVGNYPSGYEIDAPLSYADYYYVEALIRLRNLMLSN